MYKVCAKPFKLNKKDKVKTELSLFCLILQTITAPLTNYRLHQGGLNEQESGIFFLCHIPLVDLGQRFICNLAVITKEDCTGKTKWAFSNKSRLEILWPRSSPPSSSSLPRKHCSRVFIQCSVTQAGEAHCSYVKWCNSSATQILEKYLGCCNVVKG